MWRILVAAAILGGCGGTSNSAGQHWTGDPDLYGVDLVIYRGDSGLGYVDQVDFRARLKRTMEESAVYLGHSAAELAGLRIVIHGFQVYFDNDPSIGAQFDTRDATITLRTLSYGGNCQEDMPLPHELAHFFYGDPNHSGPQFDKWFFRDLWDQLHAEAGTHCALVAYDGQWARH
jgi:hypothetical protein